MTKRPCTWGAAQAELGLGIGGLLLLIALLACLGANVGVRVGLRILFPPLTFATAAVSTELRVLEPGYVPPGSGEPSIGTYGGDDGYRELTAVYPGGLVVLESNRNLLVGECERIVEVWGAEESCFGTTRDSQTPNRELPLRDGSLLLRKDDTWVALSGLSDQELIKVAKSLLPLSRSR